MIQKRIDTLKPYFKGIKLAEKYNIVEFNLKKSWSIEETDEIGVQRKEVKDDNNFSYYMFYSDSKSLDEIIDYVEDAVINRNIEIEQKEELLRMKVEELKRVFEDKSLDELNNLKFLTEDNALKLNGSNMNNKKENSVKNGVAEELSTDSQSN